MDAYRIAEALNAAHANLDAIKRRHAPAERALAEQLAGDRAAEIYGAEEVAA